MLVSPLKYETLVEQIIRVLERTELQDRLIINGIKTAQAYSWRNTTLRHEEFYGRVLEGVILV